jgi:hypothetical protein
MMGGMDSWKFNVGNRAERRREKNATTKEKRRDLARALSEKQADET